MEPELHRPGRNLSIALQTARTDEQKERANVKIDDGLVLARPTYGHLLRRRRSSVVAVLTPGRDVYVCPGDHLAVSGDPNRRPGRPSKPVTRDGSAQADLAFWLSEWRHVHGGRPSQAEIAKAVHKSVSAVKGRLYGKIFAEFDVIESILAVTGATLDERREWGQLYDQLRRVYEQEPGAVLPAPPSWSRAEPDPSDQERSERSNPVIDDEISSLPPPLRGGLFSFLSSRAGKVAFAVGLLVTTVVVVGFATSLWQRWLTESDSSRVVTVQNMVVLGNPPELTEDSTPAYLSTVPEKECASRDKQCDVPGTTMNSGASLIADCIVYSPFSMVNFNRDDAAAGRSREAAESRLWYHASLNGVEGYISEVYIRRSDRGGLGLSVCQ